MTNAEMVAHLRKMVDHFEIILDDPALNGTLPTLRITFPPDHDGDRITLFVGAEYGGG